MVARPGELVRHRLGQALDRDVAEVRRLGGQHGAEHWRLLLADGRQAFAKVAEDGAAGFAAEAAGLRWLAAAPAGTAPAIPAVLAVGDSYLVIEWIAENEPSPHAAARFGADLARLHASGAEYFGAPWPGVIAGLPLPNDEADDWPQWYAVRRLLPYARLAKDSGELSSADVALVESVCARIASLAGPAEPPSRIHGDCWAGNVLWSAGQGWLIDPAAHGGHRETDLAMLRLFGAPHLDAIMAAYQEVRPLADGWRERVPLHQLHPLLVHVCLFGGSYRQQMLAAARAALRL
jgi:fructosamine-3-kinase